MEKREKLFKDPLHGYLGVPVNYCNNFVDTKIYQRLRNVEQTSMRPLYPAAHHDRFIHSLGTYYLGKTAFSSTKANSAEVIPDNDRLRASFELACLLHDCGHAPFSHTLEHFYNFPPDDNGIGRATNLLKSLVSDQFQDDLENEHVNPSPHETFSAALILTHFQQSISEEGGDPELVARMIMGCLHGGELDDVKRIENCFIRLLNGAAIDVDKLDFIMRDTWASGVKNVSIDADRLFRAMLIDSAEYKLCFRKSALSVIQNVIDGRNYLYRWIYTHHTVLYYSTLLKNAIEKLADLFEGNSFWEKVFSIDAFGTRVNLNNHIIHLPTDGDLCFLLKQYSDSIEEVAELISHNPRRVPLWKTFAEFMHKFEIRDRVSRQGLANLKRHAGKKLSETLDCDEKEILIIPAESKMSKIKKNELFIKMDEGRPVPFNSIIKTEPNESMSFFYIFVPKAQATNTNALISELSTFY